MEILKSNMFAVLQPKLAWSFDFDSYFEEKLVLSSINGLDTISAWEHDTLYYPDSVYTKKSTFIDLIESNPT